MPVPREWKRSFEPDFSEEADNGHEVKTGLSQRQKQWLVRAWTDHYGFVPDAVPRYSEERGFFLVPVINCEWHHVCNQGFSKRVISEDPDRPENLVPVSSRSHTGKGRTWQDEEDDLFLIHPDTLEALKQWGLFKNDQIANPILAMVSERARLTHSGILYHDSRLDNHFRMMAEIVTDNYMALHPEDRWPAVKHRK